jgi:glycosyltransferase involved in cell wall biosynthesis
VKPDAVTLVVPCYNEASRLSPESFVGHLRSHPAVRFVFVDDGSTDETPGVLRQLVAAGGGAAEVLTLPKNLGKGEAVRRGVLHALAGESPALVGYWDADLSTPLSAIDDLCVPLRQHAEIQLVLGARVSRLGARISRRWHRHYLGRLFATAASSALGIAVYDTQCGAKVFRAEIARALFAEAFLSPLLFDVELLARARVLLGRERALAAMVEVPLPAWADPGHSRLRAGSLVRVPWDLVRIWRASRDSRWPRNR